MKTRWLILIFGLINVVIFMGLFGELSRHFYLGTGELEHFWALKLLDGQVPYRDFEVEYPPLVLLTFVIPALFSHNLTVYTWLFAAETLAMGLVAMVLVAALASRLGISVKKALIIYTLVLLAIGPLIIGRYDLLPAVFAIAALYFFITRRDKLAWAMLALGAAAKLYPIIIAPLFAIYYLRHQQFGRLFQGVAVFAGVILVISIPFIWISPDGFWYTISYHADRGLQSESTYASVLLMGKVLGITQVEGVFNFGSWNITSPLADTLARVSPYIGVALLAAVYGLYARALWRKANIRAAMLSLDPEPARQMINYSSLAVLAFLLASKVFSPQFLIWLAPLLPLATVPARQVWLGLFVVIGALTQYIYPYHYLDFEYGYPYLIGMLAARNLLLAVMALFLVGWKVSPVHRLSHAPTGT